MNFYEFPIPTLIDGDQLKAHIGCDDVYIRGDKLVVASATLTLDQVTDGLASYAYVAPVPPTPLQKLESAGLTVPELKNLLGLA